MKITERLNALRELMKEKKIDADLVPTDDFHGSEYVGDYFKCRKYITGFTGSAGTAVIMQDMAGLWTDGRYFIQAADQLCGSTIELFRSGEPGVPTVHQFLAEKLQNAMCLGFDGRTVSAEEAEQLGELLKEKNITFAVNEELKSIFAAVDIELIDFKLEFGRYKGGIVLADEISPDTCRFWDIHTHDHLDKDRFRRDLGNVEDAYQEVYRRLGI